MSDKAWKKDERRIAAYFGTERTPLSGGNGKQTRSDTLHETLFIEAKRRKKHSAVTLWDDTKKLAVKEGKTPVVCLAEKGRPGFWILVHCNDLVKL
jgi:hypothetical protein